MTASLAIRPLSQPPDATVRVPGSKSFTNRALACAALATGQSRLLGALVADDTTAMIESLRRLGVTIDDSRGTQGTITVTGTGRLAPGPVTVNVRLSATTARFLAPMLALGEGDYVIDGAEPMRRRPMDPLVDALRSLGVEVVDEGTPGHLPLRIGGGGLHGGTVAVRGDVSSQFLSGLLLSAPYAEQAMTIQVTTPLVSRPYIDITLATMEAFGIHVDRDDDREFVVRPGSYQATEFLIEPDASAASYFFAAAAITGGRCRVDGLGRTAVQGDMRFVDLLARMGARVDQGDNWTEVHGPPHLSGIDADLSDLSDTAQTLAAVGAFAATPTRVRGIGFIRAKETDRIAAVVRELRRCGVEAAEEDDGFVVHPSEPHGARIETYDDHRMAMSFSLIGLRVAGIEIADPGCVSKTYPAFFADLERLRERDGGG